LTPLESKPLTRAGAAEPDWVAARRAEAAERYGSLSMPTPREELWKYVDLGFAIDDFAAAEAPGAPLPMGDDGPSLTEMAGRATVVDGFTTDAEADGPVTVASLATAVVDHAAVLRPVLGTGTPLAIDKFAAAHHAFMRDGVLVHVPERTDAGAPVLVDVQAVTEGTVSFPHLTVVLEPSSTVSLVVLYRSAPGTSALAVPHLEAWVGDNARLRLTVIQEWGYGTHAVAEARVVVGRDGSAALGEAGLGGRLSRLRLAVDLEGAGSSAQVLGAYFGEEQQVLDYRYTMHHAGTNTSSDMFLKGAVEDEALSVFTGMIRIDETAQRTDAFQTNRNLILSDGASAQSVPNLEILANDVRCGHGSTMGPLDDDQRYYLMSRGLDRERADRLQVRGFFEQALQRFPEPAAVDPVRRSINRKYVAAQREGRV
jgi:Fe-S cluster assembly protein SufD